MQHDAIIHGASAAEERFRLSHIVRHLPRLVWLVVALNLLVMLCQTAVFPNFRSPDERRQVDLILAVEMGTAWPWPDPGTLPISRGSSAAGFTPSDRLVRRLHLYERPLPPRSQRPSFEEAGGLTPEATFNQLVQHPPLYYLAAAGMVSALGDWEEDPLDRLLTLLRWWNALLLAPLPLLLYATARRLRLPAMVCKAASVFPLLVPELTRSGGSVNNDTPLMLTGALLTLLIAYVLTGDTSRRTALWIGAATTVALLTKGLALILPIWVALVYGVAFYRTRRRSVIASAAIAGTVIALGLSWWIRNRIVFGVVQPRGNFLEQPPALPPLFTWGDRGTEFLGRFVERLVTTFFVQDQTGARLHDPPWLLARVVLVLLTVGVVLTLALKVMPRVNVLVLLTPMVLLTGLIAKGTWDHFSQTGEYSALQGRYLYAGLAGLAVAAVAGMAHLPDRLCRYVPLLLFALGVLIHVANTLKSLSMFWVPADVPVRSWEGVRTSVTAIFRWYALPPVVLMGVVISTAVVCILIAVELARPQRDEQMVAYPGAS